MCIIDCGGGGDPDPSAPGIWVGSQVTPTLCGPQNPNGINDADEDGLSDFCENQLAYAFRPELKYSTVYDDTRGEPYWVARPDGAGHVVIGYLLSYYYDLGTVTYGCAPPQGHDCHNGDSESIWLTVYYIASTSHWLLHRAVYSAHTGWNDTRPVLPTSYPPPPYVEYPGKLGGYPRDWVAEGKHANYFTQGTCDVGGYLGYDDCDGDTQSMRFPWSDYDNIGSEAHPLINGVASRDPSYENYGGGRVECYWTEKRFRGWVPDSIGGGDTDSYPSKLAQWGFATTGVASCDPSPPPPPPPPPLSNSITVSTPYYTANPSGGYPPYTYLWEDCGIDCTGGSSSAGTSSGTQPYTVGSGWQYLSNSQQVYWTSSGWYLRSTVTDSHGTQAQAQYYVP